MCETGHSDLPNLHTSCIQDTMSVAGGSDSSWSSGRENEVEVEVCTTTAQKFLGYSADDSDSSPPVQNAQPSRRLSKDDSLSSSNSSGDEYHMYYYDPKQLNDPEPSDKQAEAETSTAKVMISHLRY